ncbi:MAG: ABC transporter, permease protein 1 (cluster 1, maltose/g3p/polyamine/iron) [uncultured Rubrobacteraceae bacterium]|uniref:ABC transporter, permease protein 1 (Cluster 1, maltose/g3p/polyamine/iron) n=1 Tax=uncultured Rubrobacteraceae bacterium TaxID=349277 RepID=A0A6J4RVN8_9ACTN|nr:MAG: ABC transporter, permease protein 1 (cluster 1, maltose/g3p/polyamine/iron) [uncultured Rubrobacteraceae bacterium]
MSAGASETPRRGLSRKHREWLAAALFVAPDALGLLVFLGVPMVLALGLGFFEVTGFGGISFAGLDNYRKMFADPLFFDSLKVTVLYVVGFVAGVFVVSLGLALLVRQKIPFVGFFRSLFFLPHVVSLVVVGLVWQFMLTDGVGVVNQVLESVGIGGRSWLGDPQLALGTVVLVSIWFFMGYYMIIFLAGLQEIPREYYDAAKIDGARAWQLFRHITWPLLKPTSFFVLLVSTITGVAGLQAFDLIYVMTKGGPANSTSLGIFYIYQQAFQFNDYGYAAAMSSFLVLLLLAATALMFVLTGGGRFETE